LRFEDANAPATGSQTLGDAGTGQACPDDERTSLRRQACGSGRLAAELPCKHFSLFGKSCRFLDFKPGTSQSFSYCARYGPGRDRGCAVGKRRKPPENSCRPHFWIATRGESIQKDGVCSRVKIVQNRLNVTKAQRERDSPVREKKPMDAGYERRPLLAESP
jgi:hypothetical protein